MSLFTRHPLVLQTAYSDLKRRALAEARVLELEAELRRRPSGSK
jgi:hypothetical protein